VGDPKKKKLGARCDWTQSVGARGMKEFHAEEKTVESRTLYLIFINKKTRDTRQLEKREKG